MAEKIITAEGARLLTTQTGKERERLSRLFGVFMEPDVESGEMKLVLRNFPSQRIMDLWMNSTGWLHPSKAGDFVIMRGVPMKGLKITQLRTMDQSEVEVQGITATPVYGPRPVAAPKPEVPMTSEADAEDVSDVSSVDLDIELDEHGNVEL